MMDWAAWHEHYDDPASSLNDRLRCVQAHLAAALDQAPPGPVSLVSLCAGQGRDVIGVLPDHPRRADVHALLVEVDERIAAPARQAAEARGLTQVEVRLADAALVASFADALPADVLLLCGIFGNISDHDIEQTARAAPSLCRAGATVIWTRNRRPPDLTPQIRAWFTQAGFEDVAFDALETLDSEDKQPMIGVGVGRLAHPVPAAEPPAGRLFTFRRP